MAELFIDLGHFRWWPWLSRITDITLVYFLIYRMLLLVRGTRAERMLLGLGIVVFVFFISRILNLTTLNWILGNFLGSVILVIVVLFQDDLRRVLTKVGLIPGFGSDHAAESQSEVVAQIVQAAEELSSRRIGALIVVERDVGLEEYTEHAIQIDAKISHQLLVSIFLPSSPLHDGAVVLRKDRIIVGGAVLPLTFNPNISGALGTRHRAAIGLSERTDAAVVVVSEENGIISLIKEGQINRNLDSSSLGATLGTLLTNRRGKVTANAPVLQEA